MTKDTQDPREVALRRFALISPLLEPGLDPAEYRARRREILAQGTSERTLSRYLKAYREGGFDGLFPRTRVDQGRPRAIPVELVEKAMELKSELPERSVGRVIEILETEGEARPGSLKRTTLSRYIGQIRVEPDKRKAFRRFKKEHRNQLWQADLKYGPYLPHPQDAKRKIRTYLLAFLDDATRLVTHAQFYSDQRLPILEDAFRKAILKYGLPDSVYVDQGKIFVSRWFKMACARLNIRHLSAAPYSPEAKGKIERFMGTVEAFLSEVRLAQPKSLTELNQLFSTWLEEGYNHKPHTGLEGQTPEEAFARDLRPVRFVTQEKLREAFLWEEDRKVDRTGCFKLGGEVYEAGPTLAGKKVEIHFDPFDSTEVEVWHKGQKVTVAKKLDLAAKAKSKAEDKDAVTGEGKEATAPSASSRYLATLKKKEKERLRRKLGALAYRNLEGKDHV